MGSKRKAEAGLRYLRYAKKLNEERGFAARDEILENLRWAAEAYKAAIDECTSLLYDDYARCYYGYGRVNHYIASILFRILEHDMRRNDPHLSRGEERRLDEVKFHVEQAKAAFKKATEHDPLFRRYHSVYEEYMETSSKSRIIPNLSGRDDD
jgi:hypothetical protein